MKKRTLFYSLFAILIIFNVGCDKEDTIDLLPPTEVKNLSATPEDSVITLTWTNPEDADFDHVEISYTPVSAELISVNKGIEEYIVQGLTFNTEYTFTIKAIDENGNKSSGVTANATLYDIEGEYKCNEGLYYRLGDYYGETSMWYYTYQIERINNNTYKMIGLCAWIDNVLYFQIDESGNISYPVQWDGLDQILNESPVITCESNPTDMSNVECGSSNFVTFDENYGKHLLTMTIGYISSYDSGAREFYQILERIN